MRLLRSILTFAFILLLTIAAAAQERAGTISGTVTDAAHHALPGARIDVAPHGLPAVTDQEGRFTESNLKPGDYTVTISYVGLSPDTEKVTVHPGEVARMRRRCRFPS
jgi:iron complex outermembrane receptor protein